MSRHLTKALLALALTTSLAACGGGSDDSTPTPVTPPSTVDPTVTALSGLLPDATSSTDLPATSLPPDTSAALDASLLPPA